MSAHKLRPLVLRRRPRPSSDATNLTPVDRLGGDAPARAALRRHGDCKLSCVARSSKIERDMTISNRTRHIIRLELAGIGWPIDDESVRERGYSRISGRLRPAQTCPWHDCRSARSLADRQVRELALRGQGFAALGSYRSEDASDLLKGGLRDEFATIPLIDLTPSRPRLRNPVRPTP